MEEHDNLEALIKRYHQEMMDVYVSATTPAQEKTPSPSFEPPQNEQKDSDNEAEINDSVNNELIDTGHLQVRVSTENQAIPIPGAVITITRESDNKTELIRTVIADDNGLTPFLDLPTKDRRLSLEPNHPQPYAVYNVNVTADGYFPKRFIDLPIYGGVTAIQNVSMIPLPENGDRDDVLSYPQSGPAL